MPNAASAEALFQDLKRMPDEEREKFFALLAQKAFREEDLGHDELFGHLSGDYFTAEEASQYLEISMSTFRRYVHDGRIQASSTIGRSQLFAVADLKNFKKARRTAKSAAPR